MSATSTGARVNALWFAFLAAWAATLLYYGGVSPGAVASAAAGMAFLNLLAMILVPGPLRLSREARIFFCASAALFALQLLPGLGFLFPWTSALRSTHGVAGKGPGTADAYLTVKQAAQVAAYALAGTLVLRLGQAGLSRALAIRSMAVVMGVEALYAAGQMGFGWGTIPFYGKRLDLGSASGTLVNRNSFAGLMAAGLALAAGSAWACFAAKSRAREKKTSAMFESGLLWSVLAALIAAALVLSLSRGGAVAAFAGVAALPFLARARSRVASLAGAALLVGAAFLAVAAAGTEPLLERFEGMEVKGDTRVVCWKATVAGAARQPVAGFGIGAYPQAFRSFQPVSLPGQFQHAHSEYVTALFEGGAAWALLLVAALALWMVRAVRGLSTLEGAGGFHAAAAIAAVLAFALHAMVDFDLRITACGLVFAALLGLAPAWHDRATPVSGAAWGAGSVAGLALAAILAWAPLDPAKRLEPVAAMAPDAAEVALHETLALSPCDPSAAWALARAAEKRGDAALAARRFEIAASLWPVNPMVQQEAGIFLWRAGKRPEASACFRRAFEARPESVEDVIRRLGWDGAEQAAWEGLMPTAAAGGRLAIVLAKNGLWREAAGAFGRLVPATRENAKAFDELAGAFHEAGQWGLEAELLQARLSVLSDAEAHAAAARAWLKLQVWEPALENARIASRIDPGNAERAVLLAEILEARGDRLAAAEALTAALAQTPRDPALLVARARVYLGEKLFAESAQDARAALAAAPGRRDAVLVLARALAGAGLRAEAKAQLDELLMRLPGDPEATQLRAELGN